MMQRGVSDGPPWRRPRGPPSRACPTSWAAAAACAPAPASRQRRPWAAGAAAGCCWGPALPRRAAPPPWRGCPRGRRGTATCGSPASCANGTSDGKPRTRSFGARRSAYLTCGGGGTTLGWRTSGRWGSRARRGCGRRRPGPVQLHCRFFHPPNSPFLRALQHETQRKGLYKTVCKQPTTTPKQPSSVTEINEKQECAGHSECRLATIHQPPPFRSPCQPWQYVPTTLPTSRHDFKRSQHQP